MFNKGRYVERVATGELMERIIRARRPNSPKAPVPPGTESQIVGYYDSKTGRRVALFHRYVLPDGTLGASGLPDPKELFEDRIFYVATSGGNK